MITGPRCRSEGRNGSEGNVFESTRKDGEKIYLESYVNEIVYRGRPARQGVIRDITERKRIEEELKQKNEELELANRIKSEFVGIVSHDFGNPLGIIQGTVEMMAMGLYGELTPKMQGKLTLIQETVERLDKLRRDTLDLTKMDVGQLELEKEDTDLSVLIDKVVEELLPLAEQKGQNSVVDVLEGITVSIDKARLFQVVENYVSNAIRYTPEGGHIGVGLEKTGEEVVVCVKDTGRGIDPKELENVFLPFYRTGERVKGSTGLGLSIVKGIMEAHGGRAWAESEGEGKGTTFSFSLPKERSSE